MVAVFYLGGELADALTAADNVSYAGRLLASVRLRGIMRDAQEKFILPDAEQRLVRIAEKIVNTD